MMKIVLTEEQIKKIIKEAVSIQPKHLEFYNRLADRWRKELEAANIDDNQIKKFFGDDQDPASKEVPLAEQLFKKHVNLLVSKALNEDNEAVKAFLHKYDGNTPGLRKINLEQLKNINYLKLFELVDFFNLTEFNIDFFGKIEDEDPELKEQQRLNIVFNGNNFTPEKFRESKALWFNSSRAKVAKGSVRVFEIMNQSDAIRFGYYYQKTSMDAIASKGKTTYPWCVTHRSPGTAFYYIDDEGNETDRKFHHPQITNMYSYYRGQGYTFYFLIDDSKSPLDQYYITSIAINKNGTILYTCHLNDINSYVNWTYVTGKHPELTEFRDKFTYRSEDTKPLEVTSIVDRVNERDGDRYEYARLPHRVKKEYIDAGGVLTKPISWIATPIAERKVYIKKTTKNTLTERFPNLAFFNEATKKTTDKRYLEFILIDQIKYEGGINGLIKELMKSEYQVWHDNKNNPAISVIRNRNTNEFGIFNYDKSVWLELGGVKYNDDYKLLGGRSQIYLVRKKQMLVYQYVRNNIVDNSSFYVIVTLDDNRKKPVLGLIFSHAVFTNLKNEKKIKRMGKGMPYEVDFDFTTGSDIKENLRRKLLSFQ